MANELYISSSPKGDRIALLKDKRLVEFHLENSGNQFTVGDIYLGTVKKIVPGLNAAFVDIGYEKDAFLHYLDLGAQIKALNKYTRAVQNNTTNNSKLTNFKAEVDIDKMGKIAAILSKNQQILVQVVKEPISSKGPRLSCQISLAGRYVVLVPFSNSVSVSKKIADKDEKNRLLRLINSIKPDNFGVIIRTVAEGKEVAELDKDIKNLMKNWEDGYNALKTAKPCDLLIGEMGRASSILRDMLNESFDSINVDSKELLENTKEYVKVIAPDKEKIIKLHNGKQKLFEQVGIEKQILALFGKTVSMPTGGYLIIEQTEALHVIDVNSGNKSNEQNNQEDTALRTNMEAAIEVARQLRLRDMGGIIVIDFIDMKESDHRQQVFEKMRDEMVGDRSKYTILPITKFGLMQITRQRVRPVLDIKSTEVCPSCNGTGLISASINIADQIVNKLEYVLTKQNESQISIILHPFLYAYFTKGLFSIRVKWYIKYKKWINLIQDSTIGVVEYKFFDSKGEEIQLS